MAIVENPKIGRARGSVGNVIFSSQFGKNTLRTKPFNPKNPKTPAQQFQRGRFKKVSDLVRPMLKYINPAYADSRKDMPPFNHVMSINIKHCYIGDTHEIDPSLFVLCDNDGSFADNVVLTSTALNTITGTFDSNAQNDDEGGDAVKAYGFDVKDNKIWQFDEDAIRGTGTITLTHSGMSGLNIAVYFECLDRVHLLMGKAKHVIKYVGTVTVL
jgi:hypothetical protein